MFRNRDEVRTRLLEIAERFRQKGAISPEKAMTAQKLGLPPRFEQAVHRRLGQTGIFVETNGKYYLNEERFKQFEERRAKARQNTEAGGTYGGREPTWSRVAAILLMLPIGLILLAMIYFLGFGGGYFPGEFLIVLLLIFLALFVVRFVLWSSRRRRWREQFSAAWMGAEGFF
jgi:Flp pilus assembly protein TadB